MGAIPDWYELILTARYLRVPPWELHAQPVFWQRWAQAAQAAEGEFRKSEEERSKRQSKMASKKRR